jgi:hypothetical protein
MALADHDRLDKKLTVEQYTDAPCGSLNLQTSQAEYCGFDCPTLKARMTAGDDPGKPINQWPPPPVILP